MWMWQTKTLVTSWVKVSLNAHDQRTLWHSGWQLKCQICLFYVNYNSKLDFYNFGGPVSDKLIIEQGVSECLNISIVVEYAMSLKNV